MILRPRGSHDIALLSSSLSCSPDAELEWTQDVFGNLIATGIFSQPAGELVITSEFTVEQSAVAWPCSGSRPRRIHSRSPIPPTI